MLDYFAYFIVNFVRNSDYRKPGVVVVQMFRVV